MGTEGGNKISWFPMFAHICRILHERKTEMFNICVCACVYFLAPLALL